MTNEVEIDVSIIFDRLVREAEQYNVPFGIALMRVYQDELPALEKCYPKELLKSLKDTIEQYLTDHDCCYICGHELEFYHYTEYHSEVNAYEPMCDVYCPNCGG